MSRCALSEQRLQAWLDGELDDAGEGGALDIAAHVESCDECLARAERLELMQRELRGLVAASLGDLDDIEPLLAVREIHARLAERRAASWGHRLSVWWTDLLTFHRPVLITAMVAAGVGVLVGPAVALWHRAQPLSPTHGALASVTPQVVVESLQFDGDSRAVIYRPEGGKTTIIWVEPTGGEGDHGGRAEEF